MGCDIHPHFEFRRPAGPPERVAFLRAVEAEPHAAATRHAYADWLEERGVASPDPAWVRDAGTTAATLLAAEWPWRYHDWEAQYQTGVDTDGLPEYDYRRFIEDPLFIGRNYTLFGILAEVRDDDVEPVAPQRGFPPDASPETFRQYTYRVVPDGTPGVEESLSTCTASEAVVYTTSPPPVSVWMNAERTAISEPGIHSPSWLTLAELLAYDWHGQSAERRRWFTPAEWAEAEAAGRAVRREVPPDWALPAKGNVWGTCRLSYAQMCSEFHSRTMPALRALADDPRDVRIVFWFDS